MMTNAQAALLAACTQFAGAEVDVDPGTVQGVAAKYKGWLDRKDREEKEYLAQQSTPTPPRQLDPRYSTGGSDLFTGLGYAAHPGHDHEDCCK